MLKTMSFGDAGLSAPGADAPRAREPDAPKSEVNPLGGTLVATSPFADPALASAIALEAQKLASKASAQVSAATFDDNTPPAEPPAARQGSSPRLDESGAHRSNFPPEAFDDRASPARPTLPTSKNTLPLVLLVGAVVIVVVLLALALRGGGGEAEQPNAPASAAPPAGQ